MKDKKNIRFLYGNGNAGGILYNIADGLANYSIRADAVVDSEQIYDYPYQKKLNNRESFSNRILKYYYFVKYTLLYDAFIINTRTTMLARKYYDLVKNSYNMMKITLGEKA